MPTKNDDAWKKLFDRHSLLQRIERDGCVYIDAKHINEYRESRLMAKFDHYINLPELFRAHRLTILPVSRSRYVIGRFDAYQKVTYSGFAEMEYVDLPLSVESILHDDLYSEAAALLFAYNAGIVDCVVGEPCRLTVMGRMSSGCFDFRISDVRSNDKLTITVENSQCEIDAGFESQTFFCIVEAKAYSVDDFLVRQLYYPYRLWTAKLSKPVIPVLFTLSNDVFTFFVYRFNDLSDYNSMALVAQRQFSIAADQLTRDDVACIFSEPNLKSEPAEVPFPQADSFPRVVDLLALLSASSLTKLSITENYQFDGRQTGYYTDAARYLGLAEKFRDDSTGKVAFRLTERGRSIMKQRPKGKYLGLIGSILEHGAFFETFSHSVNTGEVPGNAEVERILRAHRLEINETTATRRAQTVRAWVSWIWSQIGD